MAATSFPFATHTQEVSDSKFPESTWPSILQEHTQFQPFPIVYTELTTSVMLHRTLVYQSFICTCCIKLRRVFSIQPSHTKYRGIITSLSLLAGFAFTDGGLCVVSLHHYTCCLSRQPLFLSRFATGQSVLILCYFVGILYIPGAGLHTSFS